MHKFDPEYIYKQPVRSTPTTVPLTNNRGKLTQCKFEKGSAVALKRMTTPTTFNPVEYLIDKLLNVSEKDTASQKNLYELMYTCYKIYKEKLIHTSYNMEGQYMSNPYEMALHHLLTISHSSPVGDELETYINQSPSTHALTRISSEIFHCTDRYQKEFEEIKLIAEGGFGQVFCARNKIDDCVYAVKKICLRYRNEEEFFRSLREARTLANLDHRNVITYKAAWLEPCTNLSREESLTSSSISPGYKEDDKVLLYNFPERMDTKDDMKDATGGPVLTNKPSTTSKLNLFENMSHDLKDGDHDMYNRTSNCGYSKSSRECMEQELKLHDSYEHAMLHIQMQLCKETLRDWLDLRNEALKNSKNLHHNAVCTALYIFRKILNGMEYVHEKDIIHHDLKPNNIFVEGIEYCSYDSKNIGGKSIGEVKLGDFGLACHLAHMTRSTVADNDAIAVNPADLLEKNSCIIEVGLHPSLTEKEGVGTELYAAPEQLEGRCNHKSDIYSLGIILLELLHPFSTYMERSKKIMALRTEGSFPEFFEQRYPLVASLIKKLLSSDLNDRPSINDVIKKFNSIVECFENNMAEGYDGSLNGKIFVQEENDSNEFKEDTPSTSSGCTSHTCDTAKKKQQIMLAELEEKNSFQDREIRMLRHQMYELRSYCLTLQNNTSQGWCVSRKLKKEKERKDEIIKELQEKVVKLQGACRKNSQAWNSSKKLKKENLEKDDAIMKMNRQIIQLKTLCKNKSQDVSRLQIENANKDDSIDKLKHEMLQLQISCKSSGQGHGTEIYRQRKGRKNSINRDASRVYRLQLGSYTPIALSELIFK